MEVALFNAAIFHRASPKEGGRETVGKRAFNLGFDLLRVDCMSGVSGRHDAVNLQFALITDRDLGAGRHVTAEAHGLGQPTEHALGCGFAPASPLRRRIEHRQVLGMFGHQGAAKLQRVLARGVGEFVNEALHINGVLVQVHASPETSRHMRVAHGVVDHQVGEGVSEMTLRATG